MPASTTASINALSSASATDRPTGAVPTIFLRLGDVMRITGLARSTVYRLIADESFPAPCRLGRRAVGWRCDDIAQWSAARPVLRR